jgi:hypothetical protein
MMRTFLLAGLALGALTTAAAAGPLVPTLPPRDVGSAMTLVGTKSISISMAGTRRHAASNHPGGVNSGAGRSPAAGAHRGR